MKYILILILSLFPAQSSSESSGDISLEIEETKFNIECLETDKVFGLRPDTIRLEIIKEKNKLEKLLEKNKLK